jgi:5-enolpyruvylshikimate-3-phosphate synthase
MKKWTFVALLVVGATVLGATVLREPIASAAQSTAATIVGPLDANGNVKVHEQGVVRDDHVDITFHGQSNSGSTTNCANESVYTVPAGKQLVAEFVAFDSATASAATNAVQASLYHAGQVGTTDFVSLALTEGTAGRWVGAQTIHIVFASGANVAFNTQPDTAAACNAAITVGGYLEPAP